ncbi:MAG: cysteine desulfurase [Lachnospiraceae bacterium]|nr:cysteine desulfurase [Lachnospiraceae bacterium]
MIYLDNAANTPVAPEVLNAYADTVRNYIANPNSTHPLGMAAKERMEKEMELTASFFPYEEGKTENRVIYTSGASEANNLAIKGIAENYRYNGKHIISTCLEHSSVSGSLTYLQSKGYEIDMVDIRQDGTVDLDHLQELMRKDTVLVTICAVDSELGTRQPIEQIAKIVKEYEGCYFHTDATQAIGKTEVDYSEVDLITFTPHKFFGLNGMGALVKKSNVVLTPLIHGGASTTNYRSGTPVLAEAVALNAALSLQKEQSKTWESHVAELKSYLLEKLAAYPLVQINSTQCALPYFLNMGVKGVRATAFKEALDKREVCISIKSACSVTNNPSRSVYAITKDRKRALSSFRLSFSHMTTKEELDAFLEQFDGCYKELTN